MDTNINTAAEESYRDRNTIRYKASSMLKKKKDLDNVKRIMCKVENNGLSSWIQWLFEITETQFELRGTIMLKNANVRTNINHRFICVAGETDFTMNFSEN